MRSGFNTNVRHRGVLFHVQTEDSGSARPHLITHLFFEGTILASEKQSYADLVGDSDANDAVKTMMESQHLGMLTRLRAGSLDEEITGRLGAETFSAEKGAAEDGAAAVEGGDTQPALPGAAAEPESPARAREHKSAAAADAPLDELVLDYLTERGSRSPGAR